MGKMYVEFADAQYDVSMNLEGTGLDFKRAIADVTHVPPERQKVLIKGGLLKDDTPLGKVGARAGQQFMVLGAVGELPKAPEKPVQFLEDLPEDELNKAKDLRVGLVNLGNTCCRGGEWYTVVRQRHARPGLCLVDLRLRLEPALVAPLRDRPACHDRRACLAARRSYGARWPRSRWLRRGCDAIRAAATGPTSAPAAPDADPAAVAATTAGPAAFPERDAILLSLLHAEPVPTLFACGRLWPVPAVRCAATAAVEA